MKRWETDAGVVIRAAWHNLAFAFCGHWPDASSAIPPGGTTVPMDFFGICVASAPDPACDDFAIERLRELGIRHVRVDFSYGDAESFQGRFLDRLLRDGFRVCLHLVQPLAEARLMDGRSARDRWRDFVTATLDRYGSGIEMTEIGSTPNRRKWCGYGPSGFLAAWRTAYEAAAARGVTIAGPNVTDFEPVYNIGILGILRDGGVPPVIHTDNLFVERATEPEAWDPKIAGPALAPWLKYNLVRKARGLQAVSEHYGIRRTISTHAAWSLRRIARVLEDVEEKQADYAARYACLAAASGALDRIYWGPMIGQREGLIDDGTIEYPTIPHVTYYGRVPGPCALYRIRPAFHAFKTAVSLMAGASYRRCVASGKGLEIHEFISAGSRLHAVWVRNGCAAPAESCYTPDALRAASALSRDGETLPRPPVVFTESPLYLRWPAGVDVAVKPTASAASAVRFYSSGALRFTPVLASEWIGWVEIGGNPAGTVEPLQPKHLEHGDGRVVLRDSRNSVWKMPDPRNPERTIVVKRFGVPSLFRRLLQARKPGRARRSWNGANELLRRGIATPTPLAFFEKRTSPRCGGYYVCEYAHGMESVRDIFAALSAPNADWHGRTFAAFCEGLACFLARMHGRGCFFRDLSAGNVLAATRPDGSLVFSLIDATRARFFNGSVSPTRRVMDLIRICHPLTWPQRRILLRHYMRESGLDFETWMHVPFVWYDFKHWVKQRLRPLRGR